MSEFLNVGITCLIGICVCVSGAAADYYLQRVHSGSDHGDREEEAA